MACVAGHLEVTICCNSSDSCSEGFRGFIRELLGLMEVNPMDCWVEDQDRQGLDSAHHRRLSGKGVLPTLIEGHLLEIGCHCEPEHGEEMGALNSGGVFVACPLALKKRNWCSVISSLATGLGCLSCFEES